ncbi:MAG: hypothetical protein FJ098_10665 [Deltaproteobacteria bacterium]|nr:hypothetical protein [Deltaproteobacteria bacterium]
MRRSMALLGVAAATLLLAPQGPAQAQEAQKLLTEIAAVDRVFQEATDAFWEATEIFQTTVFAYAEGDIPILSKNWAAIKEARDAADAKLSKQFEPMRGNYLKEMESRVQFMDGLIQDPAKTLGIKGRLTTEDIDKLKRLPELLRTVVTKDTEAVQGAGRLLPLLAPAITDMAGNIQKNPLKAGAYKKEMERLKKAQKKLEGIPPEGDRQIKAADSMGGSLVRFIEEKVD